MSSIDQPFFSSLPFGQNKLDQSIKQEFQFPSSQRKILYLLKLHGKLSANQMTQPLAMSSMGVRQHLQQLQEAGYLTTEFLTKGRGRPKKLWFISRLGDGLFTNGHQKLLSELLIYSQQFDSQQIIDKALQAREQKQFETYRSIIWRFKDLKSRMQKLAEIRSSEGYMSHIEPTKWSWRLVENHCPILSAAKSCNRICGSEIRLFQRVLGIPLVRVEYILDGKRRCSYESCHCVLL